MSKENPPPVIRRENGVPVTALEAKMASEAVSEMLGPNQKIFSVEKTVTVREEEILTVNGISIKLRGVEGEKIKNCLLRGTLPSQDLINHLLLEAGLLVKPVVSISAAMNVTTTTARLENIILHKNGSVIDERFRQNRETSNFTSNPICLQKYSERKSKDNSLFSSSSSSTGAFVSSGLVYDDFGNIDNGSLEELIHELVPRAHSIPSEHFTFTFLLSSRLFLTPTALYNKVFYRAHQLLQLLSHESIPSFIINLVNVLSQWMIWFPQDFREGSMSQKSKKMEELCTKAFPGICSQFNHLLLTLSSHLSAIEKHEEMIQRRKEEKTETIDLWNMSLSSCSLAQELTRMELEYLCFLGPEEIVNAFAKDSSGNERENQDCVMSEARLRASKKTTNLEAYVTWFNRLSFLVATTVVHYRKKKLRVQTIEYWIDVARECVNLGNFNSLMGIITGLNMTPIARLKKTWTKIQSGKFAVLEHQMDPSSNFTSYRSTLSAAVSRSEGTTDQRQRVIIPFFSLLVKDLYFVNEGCDSRLSQNGNINFVKAYQLAEQLKEFSKWKDVESPYDKCDKGAFFLLKSKVLCEEDLEKASYDCETPESPSEKERYKILKCKQNILKEESNV